MPLKLTPKVSKQPPAPNIFPISVPDADAGMVWVSWPQPDRITILGELKPDHFSGDFGPHAWGNAAEALLGNAMKSLDNVHSDPHGITNTSYFNVKITHVRPKSPTHASVTKGKKINPGGCPRMRLDFNPRKIGPTGLAEIDAALTHDQNLGFDLYRWLGEARLTRLDLAVDLVGVAPDDLVVLPLQTGKRSMISGANGAIQSRYFLRKKKTSFGDHASAPPHWKDAYVRVYDRKQLKIESGKAPTYGDRRHTRVEIVEVWKKKLPSFLGLPGLTKGLSAISVVRRKFAGIGDPAWLAFCDLSELRGVDVAATLFPHEAASWPLPHLGGPDPMWEPLAIAAQMPSGLAACGLSVWLEKAQP